METPSRHSFDLNGSLRVFPIPSPIKGDNYCRLEVDGVIVNDRTKYDIVNNSVVFLNVADVPNGSQLDVLVVQSEEAIGQLAITTNIDIVASNIADINTVATDIADVTTVHTNIVKVNTVADGIANVNLTAGSIGNVNIVGNNITNVNKVAAIDAKVNTVADNIIDIQNAEENADAAIAAKNAAVIAQGAAEAAKDATLAAYDQFDDRYLGAKANDPAVDNDGDALLAGSLYYNTTLPEMKLYTGSVWVAAYVSGGSFLASANNLSDLTNVTTAQTNLGLVIGTDVQAYDATIVVDADIGVSVQAFDADTAKTDAAQTFTAAQRGTVTTDDDLSFDLSATNNFFCTPVGTGTLTFTNHTAGQSGFILLDNSSGHSITAAGTTKINADDLAAISTAGVYVIAYFDNGTNTYTMVSRSFA